MAVSDDGRAAGSRAAIPATDGEPEFAVFFRREYTKVLRTVYLIARDRGHAEEITQDAFYQLLRHWENVARLEWPEAWVRRVAVRMALRHARREAIRSVLERRAALTALVPDSDASMVELLRGLPAPQRTAIVLHYYEDQPLDQVAQIMDCSVNTVKSHLHRGRTKLRATLSASTGGGRDA
jgi:RNA polymerase sigma-70 factor (ECF subfamily)